VILFGILGNILSSVGIVLLNKYLWVAHNYQFAVTLSFFHFVFTSLATRIMLHLGVFQYKASNFRAVLPLCIGSLGSVAFMNLNLAYNSVGFYQISKLACIPVTLVLEYFMYGQEQSPQIKLSLFTILAGVGIATVTDVELNALGSVYAVVAVLFTTLAQIFAFSHQKELGLDAMQLLYHTSPIIAVGMCLLIPFFDQILPPTFGPEATSVIPKPNLYYFGYTVASGVTILTTCVFAVAVNLTNYLVIGKTSPITYQVVGHLKTCMVLILGFVVFQYPIIWRNVAGILLAVAGMVFYSELKRRTPSAVPTSAPKKTDASNKDIVTATCHDDSHGHSHSHGGVGSGNGTSSPITASHGHSHSHGGGAHAHSHGASAHGHSHGEEPDLEQGASHSH